VTNFNLFHRNVGGDVEAKPKGAPGRTIIIDDKKES